MLCLCLGLLPSFCRCHELSRQTIQPLPSTPTHLNQRALSTSSAFCLHHAAASRPHLSLRPPDSCLRRRHLQLCPTHWPLHSHARPPGLPAATPHPHPARCDSPPSLTTTYLVCFQFQLDHTISTEPSPRRARRLSSAS
ncbi:hypothetical protein B0J13DRAFT_188444 [Dactylonectria estremocensis]|uniref:Secreted protein n=1 Tax=Dactylonectria estremocensis TaxID=1079267 RepID=A0A9P9JHG9_9HYPO|nr:hypothetical protein B0J13DRAFT_188444 [Dactylonectria estremocensis]